jgi:hypothetical protein
LPTSPIRIGISSASLSQAVDVLNRPVRIAESDNADEVTLLQRFANLREVRDHSEALLSDLQELKRLPLPPHRPAAFLVPHTSLFQGYLYGRRGANRFPLDIDASRSARERGDAQRLSFQIGDIFKMYGEGPAHRNVLTSVTVDELRHLLRQLGEGVGNYNDQVVGAALGGETRLDPAELEQITQLLRRIRDIAEGLWVPGLIEKSGLKQELAQIDQRFGARVNQMLRGALGLAEAVADNRSVLNNVFSGGEVYQLNACPGLPDSARSLYKRLQDDAALQRDAEILAGGIKTVLEEEEQRSVSRRARAPEQMARDATLLATIHILNCILDAEPTSSSDGVRQRVQLVTGSQKLTRVVGAFQDGALRVPVRHPRCVAWTLAPSPDLVQLEAPLSIVAAVLDDLVESVERGGRLTRAMLDSVVEQTAAPWRAIRDNLIVASRTIKRAAATSIAGADAEILRLQSDQEPALTADAAAARDQQKVSLASLELRGIDIAEKGLFNTAVSPRAQHLAQVTFHLCGRQGRSRGLVAVPTSGQFPFAIEIHREDLHGARDGVATFLDLRDLLDPRAPSTTAIGVADILANRLGFALGSIASKNWNMARVICTSAIDHFHHQEGAQLRDERSEALFSELLFARHIALRASAAEASSSWQASVALMIEARHDLERLKARHASQWSVRLAEIAAQAETIVFCAAARRTGFAASELDALDGDDAASLVRRLLDLEAGVEANEDNALYKAYVQFRISEYLIFLHLIVWSGELDAIQGDASRRAVLAGLDWQDRFNRFVHRQDAMQSYAAATADRGLAFPMAAFLTAYGRINILNLFNLGDGQSDAEAFRVASALLSEFDRMDIACGQLTERGFARRLARRAKRMIILDSRAVLRERLEMAFQSRLAKISGA